MSLSENEFVSMFKQLTDVVACCGCCERSVLFLREGMDMYLIILCQVR
jgi:hypothetical protein